MKRLIIILLGGITLIITSSSAGALTTLLPLPLTAVTTTVTATANVYGSHDRLVLIAGSTDATFSIYSITGQLLKTVKVTADTRQNVEMPKGFYVVKCAGQWSRKVVVK